MHRVWVLIYLSVLKQVRVESMDVFSGADLTVTLVDRAAEKSPGHVEPCSGTVNQKYDKWAERVSNKIADSEYNATNTKVKLSIDGNMLMKSWRGHLVMREYVMNTTSTSMDTTSTSNTRRTAALQENSSSSIWCVLGNEPDLERVDDPVECSDNSLYLALLHPKVDGGWSFLFVHYKTLKLLSARVKGLVEMDEWNKQADRSCKNDHPWHFGFCHAYTYTFYPHQLPHGWLSAELQHKFGKDETDIGSDMPSHTLGRNGQKLKFFKAGEQLDKRWTFAFEYDHNCDGFECPPGWALKGSYF